MNKSEYSNSQLLFLVLLRWLIGWHMLYEGVTKITNPAWTSKGYLSSTDGFFSGFFQWLASDSIIAVVDSLNMWGLALIGLFLLLGIFSKYVAMAGSIMVFSYYLAHPPLFEPSSVPVEGNYLFINKTLIESCALAVIALFPTEHIIGLTRFFKK